jgi:hypothetical protein
VANVTNLKDIALAIRMDKHFECNLSLFGGLFPPKTRLKMHSDITRENQDCIAYGRKFLPP